MTCATVAEVLGERGWNTYMTGKWHLTAEDEMNMASRKAQWPVGRGFERFYGFLGAETNQWYPDLVYDNHPVEQPRSPEAGYHLTEDLTDKALEFIRDAKAVAPDKPFFLYYCPGACHAPHHAPKEWIEKYRGKFDMGYEAYRELVFERQKRMGVVTGQAELSPVNPYIDATSAQGKGWPELDTVRPWDSLTGDEKRLFAHDRAGSPAGPRAAGPVGAHRLVAAAVPAGLAAGDGPALKMAERSGLLAAIGPGHVFPTAPAAVAWARSITAA